MIELGAADGDGIRIEVLGRAYPGGLWVFDDNWLLGYVQVRQQRRALRYDAFLRASDFAAFARELQQLAAGGAATAQFWPRDPWVGIRLAAPAGPDGTFRAAVFARDGGSEREAELQLGLDQRALQDLRAAVARVACAFPVVPRGSR